MHSKPRLNPADPHRIGMSDAARAALEASQRAYRQAQMNGKPSQPAAKPAAPKPAPKVETGDDKAVRMAIESARAERVKKEEAEARYLLAKRTILAQVAGVPVDQAHTLKHD